MTGDRRYDDARNASGGNPGRGGIRASARKRADDRTESASDYITQEEIEEIFNRTYGKSERDYTPYRYYQQNTGRAVSRENEEEVSDRENSAQEAFGRENSAQKGSARKDSVRGDFAWADLGQGNERSGRGGTSGFRPDRTAKGGFMDSAGKNSGKKEEYLLVDGYNIIFAWEDLHDLAETNIDSARDRLMDICSNYQGFAGCTLILVFDAYKVKGNTGSVQKYHNIYVVYTKEAETADQYIEKTVHEIGRKHRVTVATSDRLEQMIIWGDGAVRLSAAGFREAVEAASARGRDLLHGKRQEQERNRPFEGVEL